jgi:hypothetical protein
MPCDGGVEIREYECIVVPDTMRIGFNLLSTKVVATTDYVDSKVSEIPSVTVDQELNAESENAISNKAGAEAIASAITSTLNTEV